MITVKGRVEIRTYVLLGSFRADRPDPVHDLVRAGRIGEPHALREILEGIRLAISTAWPRVVDGVVVPVPGHLPGATSPLVLFAAETIAAECGWAYAPGALQRRFAVSEAKRGGARDPRADAASLAWMPPRGATTVVLVDDVVRTGVTLRACVDAIQSTEGWRAVVAIALCAVAGLPANHAME